MGWGPMNQISERIKTIRLSLGLSMEEFGKLFTPNVDKSLISRWEKEVNHPNNERMKKIAEIGDLSVETLKFRKYEFNMIGERIKEIRLSLGLSMEKFAELIDSTAKSGTVSNWETGKNLPNNERIKRIAEIGKVSIDYLNNGVTYRELEKRNIELIEENIQLKAKLDMIYEVIKT